MKLLDVDWREVFDLLPKWEALTIEQRRFLIDRSLAGYRARTRDDELIDLGWLEPVRKSKVVRYLVPQRRRFWLKLFRELSRATPFPDEAAADSAPATLVLEDYLLQHRRIRRSRTCHPRWWRGARRARPLATGAAERIWGSTLLAFFHERLLPLGGVALGPLAEGDAGFRMTEIGRYLLGEVDDFDLDVPADAGDVIVQPNFEIVFLSPSPIDQVRTRTFAAPTAALKSPESVGTLFVINRASVQRAVMAGQDAEQVIAAAGDLSKQPLPANVTRHIRDWAAEVRWIDVRPAVVVDCGDAETAVRVLSAVGKRGRLLSESVVELVDGADLTPAVRRKLISRGVFVRS